MDAHQLGRVLWDYLHIGAPLERRDAILVFGGHDLRVAEWAAQLWLDGWAPMLVCSGGLGYYTRKIWSEPEAHKFRRIAIEKGVDERAILIEDQSRNSGENVQFTRELLSRSGIELRRAICVQKPYLELRVSATLKKQWRNCDFLLSSPPSRMSSIHNPTSSTSIGSSTSLSGRSTASRSTRIWVSPRNSRFHAKSALRRDGSSSWASFITSYLSRVDLPGDFRNTPAWS